MRFWRGITPVYAFSKRAFNSLCEIPLWNHAISEFLFLHHFQFSLWDSENYFTLRAHNASWSFNSLCEIPNIRISPIKLWLENFQFSLWDSWTKYGKTEDGEIAFNSLCEIQTILVRAWFIVKCYLSILFVRFWHRLFLLNHPWRLSFQFSLWDSHLFHSMKLKYYTMTFNSLCEIPMANRRRKF